MVLLVILALLGISIGGAVIRPQTTKEEKVLETNSEQHIEENNEAETLEIIQKK